MTTEYEEIVVKAKEIHERIAAEQLHADQIRQRADSLLVQLPTTETQIKALHGRVKGMIQETGVLRQPAVNDHKHQQIKKTQKIAKINPF